MQSVNNQTNKSSYDKFDLSYISDEDNDHKYDIYSDNSESNFIPMIEYRLSDESISNNSDINELSDKKLLNRKSIYDYTYNYDNINEISYINYIKYNIQKNTYNNKKNYQIIFNKIIFNIK
jgi:hypothetical protein